jgi:hypothetical protein
MRVGVTLAAAIIGLMSGTADAQLVNTLNECGQSINYSIEPPGPEVPGNVGAFSGIWIGKWEPGPCSAIIVEAVHPDGVAQVIYVWGSYFLFGIKAGKEHSQGKIISGKLSLSADNGRAEIQYVPNGPDQLSGVYTAKAGKVRGMFNRKNF